MDTDEKTVKDTSLKASKEKETNVVKYGEAELKKDFMVGLSRVPMADIRPPQILLIQKSSDMDDFSDSKGEKPKIGQYFHTGRMQIMDSFECFILFAAKSKYISKIKPEEGEKFQYKAVGVMADDLSTFGFIFRSSALYALSSLFTAAISQRRPMFSLKVLFETKELSNDKGSWFIPVVRLTDDEPDYAKLQVLSGLAKRYDVQAEEIMPDEPEAEQTVDAEDIPF